MDVFGLSQLGERTHNDPEREIRELNDGATFESPGVEFA